MDIAEALEIVLTLARKAMAKTQDAKEHERQTEACNMIEDLAVNEYGDD